MRIARYKCDRCGIEFKYFPHPVIKNPKDNIDYVIFEDFDLCNKCVKEAKDLYNDFKKKINTWMKNEEEIKYE